MRAPVSFSMVIATASVVLFGTEQLAWGQRKVPDTALPATQLLALSPIGGRQGTQVEVRITSGNHLHGARRLIFSHPGITFERKPAEKPCYDGTIETFDDRFLVTIGPNVPVGVYDCRLEGEYGISNPRAFAIDQRQEILESTGKNHQLAEASEIPLESVVSGAVDERKIDYFSFNAKKGQRVLIDAWAQRVDSRLDATLVAYASDGRELARNRNSNRRDPLLDLAIPADGRYFIAIHDLRFAGGPEYFYRLHVHTGPYIDLVYPPVATADSTLPHRIFGRNLPDEIKKETGIAFNDSRPLLWSPEAFLDACEYRLTAARGFSNPYTLLRGNDPIVVEQEPNSIPAQAQKLNVPCEFIGQFQQRADEDWIEFQARKGQLLIIETTSQRLGLPTDPTIVLFQVRVDAAGNDRSSDLTEIDDQLKDAGGNSFTTAHGDSSYRFVAPDDGAYRLMICDLHGATGDPRRVYRVSIREPRPDFSLVAVTTYPTIGKDSRPWSNVLRRGGSAALDIVVERRDGFAGEITVTCEGLPKGVIAAPVMIGPGQDSAPLVITAAEDAPAWTGTIHVVATASLGDKIVSRTARNGIAIWPGTIDENNGFWPADARVTNDTVLSVLEHEVCPLSITIDTGKLTDVARGGKLPVSFRVIRRAGFKEAISVTASNLPVNYKAPPAQVAADATSGTITLEIPADAPPGVVSFHLKGQAKFNYLRADQMAVKDAKPQELNLVVPSLVLRTNVTAAK